VVSVNVMFGRDRKLHVLARKRDESLFQRAIAMPAERECVDVCIAAYIAGQLNLMAQGKFDTRPTGAHRQCARLHFIQRTSRSVNGVLAGCQPKLGSSIGSIYHTWACRDSRRL